MSWCSCTIHYTNGSFIKCTAEQWEQVKGEGIDFIEIENPTKNVLKGCSLYWLYAEKIPKTDDHYFVSGSAFVANIDGLIIRPETLYFKDGTQQTRECRELPDLYNKQIKIGWWRERRELK